MAQTSSPPLSEPQRESLFARLLTPLTFLSFLISLLLIDTRSTLQRSSSHNQTTTSTTITTTTTTTASYQPSTFTRLRSKIHTLIYRPSPYAYVRSPAAELQQHQILAGGGKATSKATSKEQEPWHLHTKQRKIMHMEVVDAFELRKRVVVILVLGAVSVTGLGMWGAWWGARVLLRYL